MQTVDDVFSNGWMDPNSEVYHRDTIHLDFVKLHDSNIRNRQAKFFPSFIIWSFCSTCVAEVSWCDAVWLDKQSKLPGRMPSTFSTHPTWPIYSALQSHSTLSKRREAEMCCAESDSDTRQRNRQTSFKRKGKKKKTGATQTEDCVSHCAECWAKI